MTPYAHTPDSSQELFTPFAKAGDNVWASTLNLIYLHTLSSVKLKHQTKTWMCTGASTCKTVVFICVIYNSTTNMFICWVTACRLYSKSAHQYQTNHTEDV